MKTLLTIVSILLFLMSLFAVIFAGKQSLLLQEDVFRIGVAQAKCEMYVPEGERHEGLRSFIDKYGITCELMRDINNNIVQRRASEKNAFAAVFVIVSMVKIVAFFFMLVFILFLGLNADDKNRQAKERYIWGCSGWMILYIVIKTLFFMNVDYSSVAGIIVLCLSLLLYFPNSNQGMRAFRSMNMTRRIIFMISAVMCVGLIQRYEGIIIYNVAVNIEESIGRINDIAIIAGVVISGSVCLRGFARDMSGSFFAMKSEYATIVATLLYYSSIICGRIIGDTAIALYILGIIVLLMCKWKYSSDNRGDV